MGDENAQKLSSFDDVRVIEAKLKSNNLKLERETGAENSGPASIVVLDPDGNQILIDQHV